MKKKIFYAVVVLLHFSLMLLLSSCDGCCKDCGCCLTGSSYVETSKKTSWCQSHCEQSDGKVYEEHNDPDNKGCSAVCAAQIGKPFNLPGCTDPSASNYNKDARMDNGSCKYGGCMDPCATNPSLSATEDDGSCIYESQCLDASATNDNKRCHGNAKVINDLSKCRYKDENPNPVNPDTKKISISDVGYCLTSAPAATLSAGSELTFTVTYTYSGSRKIYLKMLRDNVACSACDAPKLLSGGENMKSYSQYLVPSTDAGDVKFSVQIVTDNNLSATSPGSAPEEFAEKIVPVKIGSAFNVCGSLSGSAFKGLEENVTPKKPNVTDVTFATGKMYVKVKNDVREPSIIPSSTISDNQKRPDYYIIAFDEDANRKNYANADNSVDWSKWYSDLAENGKGKLAIVRPTKSFGEEEVFAIDADNSKKYQVFVKALNITWPYKAPPPSSTPAILSSDGSEFFHDSYPKPQAIVVTDSKDRMYKATVTIPAGFANASFTLKSATQDMGTYDRLLSAETGDPATGRTYHIYASENDMFSDEENAATLSDAYINQKVVIIADPANPRKFDIYTVFNTLEPVSLNISLDGEPTNPVVRTLTTDTQYGFAEWIDLANRVVEYVPPAGTIPALAKTSAGVDIEHPGLVTKCLISAFAYTFRLEIAWIKGFYDGVFQGLTSDKNTVVSIAKFFRHPWMNASNFCLLVRKEAPNFTLAKLKDGMYGLFENLSVNLVSSADQNILYPDADPNTQVKAYMHGYLMGFALEQVAGFIIPAKGFQYAGRGLLFLVDLCKAPVALEAVDAVRKWSTVVIAAGTRHMRKAAAIPAEDLRQLHQMVEKLETDVVAGTGKTYAEKLGEFSNHAAKTVGVGEVTEFAWATKGLTAEKRLVEMGEILAGEGSSLLSEEASEGFLRYYGIMSQVEGVEAKYLDEFLEAFEGIPGHIDRELLNEELTTFGKLTVVNAGLKIGKAITQADLDAIVNAAKKWQSSPLYPNADAWVGKVLPKGTRVWVGLPGVSGFFITEDAMASVGTDLNKLYEGLQIAANPKYGPRRWFIRLELTEDLPAATSAALANTQHGAGGLSQFFIENWHKYLQPVDSKLLIQTALPK